MIRKIIQIEEEKCNGCGAWRRCLSRRSNWYGKRKGEAAAAMITAMDWRIVFLPVLLEPLPLQSGRLPRMMRLRSFKIKRENKHITQAAPGTKCTSLIGIRGYLLNPFRPLVFHSCGQWPCQIKLVPVNAPYFDGAKLLIAADCTAYAYARLHEDFMKERSL